MRRSVSGHFGLANPSADKARIAQPGKIEYKSFGDGFWELQSYMVLYPLQECPKCGKISLSQRPIQSDNGNILWMNYRCISPGCGFNRTDSGDADWSCFPGDSKIMTPKGPVRLDSLKSGDVVTSWQKSSGIWVSRAVKKVVPYGLAPITRLDLSDGSTVRVTDHHTIHTSKGWKKVRLLKQGDRISSVSGEVRVLRIYRKADLAPVYNLHCEGEYNFVADGVIAHSFTTLRATRVVLNKIADRIYALWVERHPILKAPARQADIKAEFGV